FVYQFHSLYPHSVNQSSSIALHSILSLSLSLSLDLSQCLSSSSPCCNLGKRTPKIIGEFFFQRLSTPQSVGEKQVKKEDKWQGSNIKLCFFFYLFLLRKELNKRKQKEREKS
ncbi:hypothetical protein S245_060339, partial [Arachis hypogaea]